MNAIVIGLGFGDEGKGSVVNSLVRDLDGSKIVVRFNSGPQAGHTVVQDDKRHVFSSFGAGTLSGADTYLSKFFYVEPGAFIKERESLSKLIDIESVKVYIHPLCPMITPWDTKANQIDEENLKHGTCGIGFGKAARREEESPYKLYFKDILSPVDILVNKLEAIRLYYGFENSPEMSEIIKLFVDYWFKMCEFIHLSPNILSNYNHHIFEGAQGVLLDRDHGVFPYVTRSKTTIENAYLLCKEVNISITNIYLVSRVYLTRHGNGPLPGENHPIKLINNSNETNVYGKFQGHFRIAPFNLKLFIYATTSALSFTPLAGEVSFMFTCLDQIDGEIPVIDVKNELVYLSWEKFNDMLKSVGATGQIMGSVNESFVSLESIKGKLEGKEDIHILKLEMVTSTQLGSGYVGYSARVGKRKITIVSNKVIKSGDTIAARPSMVFGDNYTYLRHV